MSKNFLNGADKVLTVVEHQPILTANPHNSSNLPEVASENFVRSFWYWDTFSSYVHALAFMVLVIGLMSFIWRDDHTFAATIGTISSGIEALIGIPQLHLNCSRKSTEGL